MNSLILQYHDWRVTGTFTTVLDAAANVNKFIDVDFKTIWGHDTEYARRYLKENNFFGTPWFAKSITYDTYFERETIICSSKLFCDISHSYDTFPNGKDRRITMHCRNLIVLDSMDMTRSYYNHVKKIDDYVKAENCVFLCNPANFRNTRFPKYEYYHKLNKERLDSQIPYEKKYNFKRSQKPANCFGPNMYFENVGKRIFEYIYHGYPVNYYTDGMFMKDGLYYYLKLFGVDGFKEHKPLKITRKQISDILFMNENDLLLDIIGG